MDKPNTSDPSPESTGAATEKNLPVFTGAFAYIRQYWQRFVAVSVFMLIPCFWHRWIMAEDLGSHLYNAWLVQLIRHGKLPGIVIVGQWSNVLFDFILSSLSSVAGFWAAEKMAVSLAVLIFFWGAFAFISANSRKAPWMLVPVLALATYGWIFNMGFFNYYLSIGFSFWGMAILIAGKGKERFWGLAVGPLVVLAHPLGAAWFAAAAVYLLFVRILRIRYQILLALFAVGVVAGAHFYILSHYAIEATAPPLFRFNGADQLALFGHRYWVLWPVLTGLALLILASDLLNVREHDDEHGVERRDWLRYAIPAQLYAVILSAAFLIPRVIYVSHIGSIGYLTERLTLIAAILGCAILGAARPRVWHLAASLGIALCFFSFLYQDTGRIEALQQQAFELVNRLPAGERVMSSVWAGQGSRVEFHHIVDRACIGHCFSYGNYEPSSNQFRLRVAAPNPFVVDDPQAVSDMDAGNYYVKRDDLPAYEIYQCTPRWTDLCLRSLRADEMNGLKQFPSAIARNSP